jgi:hypothetical protein
MNEKFINDITKELCEYIKGVDLVSYKSFIRYLNANNKYFLKCCLLENRYLFGSMLANARKLNNENV